MLLPKDSLCTTIFLAINPLVSQTHYVQSAIVTTHDFSTMTGRDLFLTNNQLIGLLLCVIPLSLWLMKCWVTFRSCFGLMTDDQARQPDRKESNIRKETINVGDPVWFKIPDGDLGFLPFSYDFKRTPTVGYTDSASKHTVTNRYREECLLCTRLILLTKANSESESYQSASPTQKRQPALFRTSTTSEFNISGLRASHKTPPCVCYYGVIKNIRCMVISD